MFVRDFENGMVQNRGAVWRARRDGISQRYRPKVPAGEQDRWVLDARWLPKGAHWSCGCWRGVRRIPMRSRVSSYRVAPVSWICGTIRTSRQNQSAKKRPSECSAIVQQGG